MPGFTISLDDKPNLLREFQENPETAKEIVATFVSLMETAVIQEWAKVPKDLHKDLTLKSLVSGILHGSLDLPDINPETYDALGVEVHPLAMLSPRKNYVDGGMKIVNWRNHFRLPPDTEVSEETVANIFRRMLRYAKYIKFDKLAEALESNQIAVHRGLGHEQIEKLPFYPALRYQKKHLGDLAVGKFYDDVGFFNCGPTPLIENGDLSCPACKHEGSLHEVGDYEVCLVCNAGFKE